MEMLLVRKKMFHVKLFPHVRAEMLPVWMKIFGVRKKVIGLPVLMEVFQVRIEMVQITIEIFRGTMRNVPCDSENVFCKNGNVLCKEQGWFSWKGSVKLAWRAVLSSTNSLSNRTSPEHQYADKQNSESNDDRNDDWVFPVTTKKLKDHACFTVLHASSPPPPFPPYPTFMP